MTSIPKRRCFARDFIKIFDKVEIETGDQAKIIDFDENLSKFHISIIPSGSDYAHAQFIFMIAASAEYPETAPTVVCKTPIFHPNIDFSDEAETNVCVNLLREWESCFDLMDVIIALLFLFYEPNYEDPYAEGVPIENDTASECIRKCLAGENVYGIRYPVNLHWKSWMDAHHFEGNKGVSQIASQPSISSDAIAQQCSGKQSPHNGFYLSEIPCNSEPYSANYVDQDASCCSRNLENCDLLKTVDLYQIDIVWLATLHDDFHRPVTRYYFAQSCFEDFHITPGCGPHFRSDVCSILDGHLLRIQRGSYTKWLPVKSCEDLCGKQEVPLSENSPTYLFKDESKTLNNLRPYFWPLYQTHWPYYSLPGSFLTKCLLERSADSEWPRASDRRFLNDLLFYTDDLTFNEAIHLVVVDPLALSPLSPVVNRMLPMPSMCASDQCLPALVSLDWVSGWQSLFPPVRDSCVRPYRLRGLSSLAWLVLVSNWFNWASRAELYQSVLGYSRPGLTAFSKARRVTDPFALSSIAFPSLCCGQAALVGAWPLWLLASISRAACRLLGIALGRFRGKGQSGLCPADDLSKTRVFFPFTDIDEI